MNYEQLCKWLRIKSTAKDCPLAQAADAIDGLVYLVCENGNAAIELKQCVEEMATYAGRGSVAAIRGEKSLKKYANREIH